MIVANGSSVDAMPPAFWRAARRAGCMLVGTNRALAFASLQGVTLDAMVLRDRYDRLWADADVCCRYHDELWKPFAGWKVGPATMRVAHCDEFVRFAGPWQPRRVPDENGEAAVMAQSTVALMAANWAWLCGAREIFLVGVDYGGPHARMLGPYGAADTGNTAQYTCGGASRPAPRCIERQFAEAVSAVEALGGRMVNLSATTRLRAVPVMGRQRVFRRGAASRRTSGPGTPGALEHEP